MAYNNYAEKLRVALECDDWSQGRLVRELAARTGNAVASERSAVRGYLRGDRPRPDRAKLIAEIMDVPELAQVDNPRRAASARFEDRLAELEKTVDVLLGTLEQLVETQQAVLAALESIRQFLGIPLDAEDTPATQSRDG